MSTETQLIAVDRAAINRENAQHSTGPRTEAGKGAVRLNAVKHGLYSQTVVLPSEDRAAYDALGASLQASLQPANEKERELVQTIQDSRWFLARASVLETNLYVLAADQQRAGIDERYANEIEEVRQALAEAAGFQVNFRQFDQLSRAGARVRRNLENATKELNGTQAERKLAPAAAPDMPSRLEHFQADGFVSQGELESSTERPEGAGFVSPQPQIAAPTEPKSAAGTGAKVQMPKFTGPQAKKDRKRWLRTQAKKNAAA